MEFHDSLHWRALLKYDGQFQFLMQLDHKNQTITNYSCGHSLLGFLQQVLLQALAAVCFFLSFIVIYCC
jgi:hypothetical protein